MQGEGVKHDAGKTRYELLEPWFERAVADVLSFGAKKYEDENWKKVEPLQDRYYGALRRHIDAWRSGEEIDSESGLPHLAHATCCLYFLMWKDKQMSDCIDEGCQWIEDNINSINEERQYAY